MVNNIRYKQNRAIVIALFSVLILASCTKEQKLAGDPYDGKKSLGIAILSKSTEQSELSSGEELTIKVQGLSRAEYKDTDFEIFLNEIKSTLIARTDSTITFSVPIEASTGSMWITVKDQTFFGPIVKIAGKVSVDEQFKIVNGASNLNGFSTVYDIEQLPNGRFWLGGAFNNFELKGSEKLPIGGIAQIDADGAYTTSGINFGKGIGSGGKVIYSIARIPTGTHNGKFIIAGDFKSYNSTRSNRQTLNNIVRLNENGTLDSSTVAVANPKPTEVFKNRDTVATFNAGVDGAVRKVFAFGNQVYIVGSFFNFRKMFYENSTYDQKYYDITRMRQLVRVNEDGSMDSTFHYNKATRQSAIGANGGITDAIMQSDGKLILVGTFTTFNGSPANHIVRLNLDGSKDNTFSMGTGANADIYSIRYNSTTQKIIIAGLFTSFNGKPATGVNLLNADGSNDANFNALTITGGIATFAGQLNGGKIIVAGSFYKYGDYIRQGFMILESDGKLAVGYNNTGGFQGRIFDMVESPTVTGSQVVLVGDIQRFNTTLPKNVLRINISN